MIHIGNYGYEVQPLWPGKTMVEFLEMNPLLKYPKYALAMPNSERKHRGWFYSYAGNEKRFVLDCHDLKQPIDILFYNNAGEILAVYNNYEPSSEMPYSCYARGAYVFVAGTLEKCAKIGEVIRFDGPSMYKDLTKEIETADRYFKFRNEVFAEKWNTKHNFNQRFYYSYYKHRWTEQGGTQFASELREFEQIQGIEREELTREQALEFIRETEQRLTTDFQAYKEKYYRSGTCVFSHNAKDDICRIYDFIQGWINVRHVSNIEEFSCLHLTKEEAEQEIKKLSACDKDTKQFMNLKNVYESGNFDMFHEIGYYAHDKKTNTYYKIITEMSLVIKLNSLWSRNWEKYNLKYVQEMELEDTTFEEIHQVLRVRLFEK